MKKSFVLGTMAAMLALSGCAVQPYSSTTYSGRQVQSEQSVRMGVVESIRNVMVDHGSSGVGVVGGAALGGLAGDTIGHGNGSIAGAIGGAIVGGLIGQQAEKSMSTTPGLEITVRLDNGALTAIVQDANEPFYIGDRVRLLSNGRTTRVSH